MYLFGGERKNCACIPADLENSVLTSARSETAFVLMSGTEKKERKPRDLLVPSLYAAPAEKENKHLIEKIQHSDSL